MCHQKSTASTPKCNNPERFRGELYQILKEQQKKIPFCTSHFQETQKKYTTSDKESKQKLWTISLLNTNGKFLNKAQEMY